MASPSSDALAATLLGVFARYWQPGAVKTRLARRVGNEQAAHLHRQFVEATLGRLSGIGAEQWLEMSPAEVLPQVPGECSPALSWHISAQVGNDLGERMHGFFQRAHERAARVVLVGSDSPDLPRQFAEQAFSQLLQVPVVLGPAADGGYYLIGLAAHGLPDSLARDLFEGIPWGTSQVLPMTRERLASRGIEYHLLPVWQDVDEWDDLLALHKRLSSCDDRVDEPLRASVATVVAEFTSVHHCRSI